MYHLWKNIESTSKGIHTGNQTWIAIAITITPQLNTLLILPVNLSTLSKTMTLGRAVNAYR